MKSLKTKVIMSAFVLLFALVATIGSTYAWFTLSETVTVSQLTLTVNTEESLLIRPWDTGQTEVARQEYSSYNYGAGATAWQLSDFLSTTNIANDSTYYSNYGNWKLSPVTSLSGGSVTSYTTIDITNLQYISDLTNATRPLASGNSNTASGHYLEFKFWLLRTSADGTKLDVAMNQSVGGTYANALWVGTNSDDFALVGTDLAFASGTNTITSTTSDLSVFKNGESITISGTASNDGTYTINGVPTETSLVVSEALTDESAGVSATITYSGFQTIFGSDLDLDFAFAYGDAGYQGTPTVPSAADSVATKASLLTDLAAITGTNGTTPVIRLEEANVPELISVIVWLEGWDAETTNLVMGSSLTLDITFSLLT